MPPQAAAPLESAPDKEILPDQDNQQQEPVQMQAQEPVQEATPVAINTDNNLGRESLPVDQDLEKTKQAQVQAEID